MYKVTSCYDDITTNHDDKNPCEIKMHGVNVKVSFHKNGNETEPGMLLLLHL